MCDGGVCRSLGFVVFEVNTVYKIRQSSINHV